MVAFKRSPFLSMVLAELHAGFHRHRFLCGESTCEGKYKKGNSRFVDRFEFWRDDDRKTNLQLSSRSNLEVCVWGIINILERVWNIIYLIPTFIIRSNIANLLRYWRSTVLIKKYAQNTKRKVQRFFLHILIQLLEKYSGSKVIILPRSMNRPIMNTNGEMCYDLMKLGLQQIQRSRLGGNWCGPLWGREATERM